MAKISVQSEQHDPVLSYRCPKARDGTQDLANIDIDPERDCLFVRSHRHGHSGPGGSS